MIVISQHHLILTKQEHLKNFQEFNQLLIDHNLILNIKRIHYIQRKDQKNMLFQLMNGIVRVQIMAMILINIQKLKRVKILMTKIKFLN